MKHIAYRDPAAATTSQIWEACHLALLDGRWGAARALLDELGQRDDNHHELGRLDAYEKASGRPLQGDYRAVIADRLVNVNTKARTCPNT